MWTAASVCDKETGLRCSTNPAQLDLCHTLAPKIPPQSWLCSQQAGVSYPLACLLCFQILSIPPDAETSHPSPKFGFPFCPQWSSSLVPQWDFFPGHLLGSVSPLTQAPDLLLFSQFQLKWHVGYSTDTQVSIQWPSLFLLCSSPESPPGA